MEEEYVCVACGHRFAARKSPDSREYIRCSECRSYWVVPRREYEACKEEALKMIATTTFGIIPLWDIIVGVFSERGVRLYPRLTLRLCAMLRSDIIEELKSRRGSE